MSEIQIWFDKASEITRVFRVEDNDFIIYKGFKITKNELGAYMLQDVRFSNMYAPVNVKCFNIFKDLGFVKGVDSINFQRNTRRVEYYKRRTGLLYDKRARCKRELPNNKRLNEKRIRNINRNIQDYVDMIFLYQTRIKQFNFKYRNDE